jgi:crotonobetainyl-CoA:carnitine CoA-transferase CaiB-like acyl-CoA transferase
VRNRDAIDSEIAAVIATGTRAHWIELLETARIPVGPINSVSEAVASPQAVARQMVVEMPLTSGDSTKGLGLPFQFSKTPSSIRRPPPGLGADTVGILTELGMSPDHIDALNRRGVI